MSSDAPARDGIDRAFDVGMALTIFGAAVSVLGPARDRPVGVAIALSAVNVVVGCLFLLRSGAAERASVADVVRSLPSIVASGVAYRIAAAEWPLVAIVVHGAFALVSIAGLLMLGRSFAILPARRAIVARGPYRLVRHPIYLGELGMIVTACATRGWLQAVAAFVVMLLLVTPRMLAEENLLAADGTYGVYRSRVRHRLLPGLF